MSIADPDRYRLLAYACQTGGIWPRSDEGTLRAEDILTQRPNDCRYAVVLDARGRYLCVDLYDLQFAPLGMHRMTLPPEQSIRMALGKHTVHPTLDAALMAATLQL